MPFNFFFFLKERRKGQQLKMRNERVIENSCKTIFFFRQYKMSKELRGLRVEITLYEQCGVATLESHG